MHALSVALVNQPWNPAIPPVRSGSVAIWVYEIARRLTERHRVTVHSRTVQGIPRTAIADGVKYVRHSIRPNHYGSIGRFLLNGVSGSSRVPDVAKRRYFGAYFRRVARTAARDGADVIHIHNFGQAAVAARRAHPRARIILHMHCEWLAQLPDECVSEWIDSSTLILGCSEHITRTTIEKWPAAAPRCATLHNAVDVESFSVDGPAVQVGDTGDEIVLFVGRISPEKGLHILLQAIEQVLRTRPRARLVIAGPDATTPLEYLAGLSSDPAVRDLSRFYRGSYIELLKSMIDPNWRDRVTFVGSISHELLPQWYRAAHVLANPSLSESFGLTVLEAMACGTPVVVTPVGGMPEVVKHGAYGAIVDRNAVQPLAEAIIRQLEMNDRGGARMREAAEYVRDRFSWNKISQNASDLYARACASRY